MNTIETKEILNIRNTRLDYRNPVHKLLADILTEYYGGPQLLNKHYIYSVAVLDDKDYVYVEKRDSADCFIALNDEGKIPGGLLFPREILDNSDPVKSARLFGLRNLLKNAINKIDKLEIELRALELERKGLEQDLLSLGVVE